MECSEPVVAVSQPSNHQGGSGREGSRRAAASLTCMSASPEQVYLSLLRMYLSPPSIHCLGPIKLELLEPQANLQAALQVLELHYSKLDTTKVGGRRWSSRGRGLEGGRHKLCLVSLLISLTCLHPVSAPGDQPSASKHSDQ